MQTYPYLNFDGDCATAFRLYEECLGGKIQMMMTFGESPMADQFPKEAHDRILHASLVAGDAMLMGSDVPPGAYERPAGVHVMLSVDEAAEAERIFAALADGGQVTMPLEKSFWAERFGMLVDRFGISWMINCEGES